MSMVLPIAAAAAALLLLGGGSKAKAAAKPRAAPRRAIPQGMAIRTAPKSAPKSAAPRGTVTMGPVRVIKRAPPASVPQGMSAPLAKSPSQGGTTPIAAPLSADIATDYVPPTAQRSAQTPRSQPGYNPTVARRGATALANHLKRSGKARYDRRLLTQWQTQAGLKPDGIYGPASRGALVYYGIKDPPAAFVGTGTTTFNPPG